MNQKLLCPSYFCKPGAQLFGIVNEVGRINYLRAPLEIDETFVSEAQKGRDPEKRFRFAGACVKNGCKNWNESSAKCTLIDTIIEAFDNTGKELNNCSIRNSCRWYAQEGRMACANCSQIVRSIQ